MKTKIISVYSGSIVEVNSLRHSLELEGIFLLEIMMQKRSRLDLLIQQELL